ncbi:hypothetical protein [Streptomyces sp. TR06-5]|uniref:hypothetical protein n=1 Tax=unclassified Streptomyces TaxID=2593676 RepID=UPI0039A2EC46
MTTLMMTVGGAVALIALLMATTVRRERRRERLASAFGPETKNLADMREARRTAHSVREAGALRTTARARG